MARRQGRKRKRGTSQYTKILGGKPAIVSFWGVTCKPCLTELNTLNELLDEWREEVDFNVIAVSIDDSRFTARARSMAQGYDWNFICLFDKNQDLKRAMNVTLTPHTFVIDGNGKSFIRTLAIHRVVNTNC